MSRSPVSARYSTPDALYVGPDSFSYKLAYGEYESNTATVTIDVTNAAPSASADSYTIVEDQRLTVYAEVPPGGPSGSGIDDSTPFSAGMFTFGPESGWYGTSNFDPLLENDTDSDSDILRAILVSDVTNGKLAFFDDGSFVYSPNANFVGSDTFTYYATDGIADSATVTATINVTAGPGTDLDGRDITTGSLWMTEGRRPSHPAGIRMVC